ncbi:MAG TPA: 8-amino-7-oxononanoate synthase [Steroidobacteraceae bacterium]|nr:8-amino-7-oxononanoate synthase [Steroidobacteraceae bacterium]
MPSPPSTPDCALAEIERQHLTRVRRTVEGFGDGADTAHVVVEGRRVVNFCGNDYLGLARDPRVAAALRAASEVWGVGSGASHLVTGHGREHAALEEELAQFVRRERALLLSTGYMANLAAISALAASGDLVLLDRLSHASLIDAALLSRARLRRYAHASAAAAERLLAVHAAGADGGRGRTVIATDGVFSMDGDLAPLAELARLAHARGASLLLDDAHGLGVLGACGRGSLEHCGILDAGAVALLVGTLGKAFGTFGAFVAGARELIELIIQRGRSYIYTTALPPALAAATRTALALAQAESWRRERVLALAARFRRAAEQCALPLAPSDTPIQPVVLGTAEAALAASRRLLECGFWVAAIRPPTVPQGSARLRITLSAAHREAEVDALIEALALALRGLTAAPAAS